MDKRGVIALRGLDGHFWSEDVPAGQPVFGVPAKALQAVRKEVLRLDAATLTAVIDGLVLQADLGFPLESAGLVI